MATRRFKKERHPFASRPPLHVNEPLPVQPTKDDTEVVEKPPEPRKPRSRSADYRRAREASWEATWTPGLRTAVKLILSARLCAMVWSYISDCDETFNYWEPLHYMLHKRGFQTWEYSPVYAIRSYAYILLHAIPLKVFDVILQPNRFTLFYFLRLLLAVASVTVDGMMYRAVWKRFGPSVARTLLLFLIFAPGMFISSTAFLPSSFAMMMTTAAFTAWLSGRDVIAVACIAASALLGWPFAGVLGIPIAIDVIKKSGIFFFIGVCIVIGGAFVVAIVSIDSSFYGKLVFPPLNIVLYNIFSGHGPELYGVEPWYFYLLNGFLNFNIALFLALICPVVVGIVFALGEKYRFPLWDSRSWNYLLGASLAVLIWFGIFFTAPHKEERFLFPVYSLMALLAAAALDVILKFTERLLEKFLKAEALYSVMSFLLLATMGVFVALSLSRTFALARFYTAPMDVYIKLQNAAANETTKGKVNLCVGKEWYRYPSSFFLPDSWNLQFIQSEFHGLLPKPYDAHPDGYASIPSGMNDENKEEVSRYVDVCQCRYLVDFDVEGKSTELEPRFAQRTDEWTVVAKEKFLDASRSHRIMRAFYVPWLSETKCSFDDYVLLKRRKPCTKSPPVKQNPP